MTSLVDGEGNPLFRLFVGIPTHDHRLHAQTCAGLLDLQDHFGNAVDVCLNHGHLPLVRDVLLRAFLQSKGTHMLFVDSDIGFRARHVAQLLHAAVVDGEHCISGVYLKKRDDAELTAMGLVSDGEHYAEMRYVPAGFLLMSRQMLEHMVETYGELRHGRDKVTGELTLSGLWLGTINDAAMYEAEDYAFCTRARKLGYRVQLHKHCIVDHWGEARWTPQSVQKLLAAAPEPPTVAA
jgi:hypothetical protein